MNAFTIKENDLSNITVVLIHKFGNIFNNFKLKIVNI